MQTLLIATRNAHKTREIGQMLGSGWRVSDLLSFPHSPVMEETGATFEENAALKALAISRIFTGLVLADDSGLEVDALTVLLECGRPHSPVQIQAMLEIGLCLFRNLGDSGESTSPPPSPSALWRRG